MSMPDQRSAGELAATFTARQLANRLVQAEHRLATSAVAKSIAENALREIARGGRGAWNLDACRNRAVEALARIEGRS